MNFDKRSKSEDFFFFFLGGGGCRAAGLSGGKVMVGFRPKKKNNSVTICARALYKIQVPSSIGFLVLTQTQKSNGQVRGISLPMF